VRELFRRVRNDYPKMVRLYLYGELFGGGYPHPEVAPAPGVQPVQTGVWYTPDIRFCAFDMRIETGEGHRCYVDYADVLKRCTEVCIFAAAPLFVGRYEAAMEQGIRFDSTIPRALGLPALPSGTNLAEGVVVKPYQEIAITNAKGERIRPVLKRKIEEFAEDKRFHAAAKWENPAVPVVTPLDLLQWEASCRIVENRLNAAASKIGFVPHKTPGKASLLFTLLVNEVLDEVQAALPDASAALAPSEHETLRIHVVEEVRCLLKTR
jgi:Rnl2 family RNA ligase